MPTKMTKNGCECTIQGTILNFFFFFNFKLYSTQQQMMKQQMLLYQSSSLRKETDSHRCSCINKLLRFQPNSEELYLLIQFMMPLIVLHGWLFLLFCRFDFVHDIVASRSAGCRRANGNISKEAEAGAEANSSHK